MPYPSPLKMSMSTSDSSPLQGEGILVLYIDTGSIM